MLSGRPSAKLDVVLAPGLLGEASLQGALCVVVDVLRASTTIIAALASGANEVRACINSAEARQCAGLLREGTYLLGGEEMGRPIGGFHLGNSPLEYLSPSTVDSKTILLSTANGTPTLRKLHMRSGAPVYIAALVNASAVSSAIAGAILGDSSKGVVIVCAGQDGKPTAEDILCAGLIVQRFGQQLLHNGITLELTDGALIAATFASCNEANVADVLAAAEHGRYLRTIGFVADLEFAGQIDTYNIVPVFDKGRITTLAGR